MKHYLESTQKVLEHVDSSENGLSSAQAEERLAKNGKNKLIESQKTPLWKRFLEQLADPMIIVLLVAAALSAVTAVYENESFTDVFIILFVVILNAVLGIVQESKAEEAIEALKQMTAAESKVYRDGNIMHVKSEDLAVGDVIVLEAGDAVPADARILECASLQAEESALTGESVPVNKISDAIESDGDVPLGDRKNMLYMGSTVVYGRGTAVVTACGMDTEMGNIAAALENAKDEQTPLQLKLAQLSKILTKLVLAICIIIFAVGLIRAGSFSGAAVINTFMVAVSLAVAAIPEGLVAVVTIVLSMGVTKMSKRNAVIRQLTAVETLGCAQIICSDKTGTLTQNKMTVVDSKTVDENALARAMSLCSDAEPSSDGQVIGEPTECALVTFAENLGLAKASLKAEYPRIGEAPFDSMRKMMTTVHDNAGSIIQFTKGAPDEILRRCTNILTENGVRPITDEDRKNISAQNKEMADKALRVLAAATKTHSAAPTDYSPEALEKDMTFIGLTGMIDPIRPEVKVAVDKCKQAGIRAIMITGDHKDTAVAIARDLGILEDASQAITGAQLNEISDEDFEKQIENLRVYARVQPEHKVRIVNTWKKKGKITAMTGDGVNDAPSIKSADIGIGMGITGTDVTKNVADMILADDNFATIVSAVGEGRRIYANIRKAIQFLLSSNLSEVVSIFISTILGFVILKPAHLLWINLITDSLPALALGMEGDEADTMTRPPRDPKEGIFAGGLGIDTLYQGIIISLLTLAAYFIGHFLESGVWEIANSDDGMTMAFLTLSMAEIFHSFNLRSRRGSIFTVKEQNIFLWGAGIIALILTTAVIYIPFLSQMFGFTSISFKEYTVALALAFSVIPIVEAVKFAIKISKK